MIDIQKMGSVFKKCKYFVTAADVNIFSKNVDTLNLKSMIIVPKESQISLFEHMEK